jgi:coproporphyrinogen III oxidase-like Fe-S oxidoreductase
MQEQGKALLKAAGFENYEISAYAKPGYECRHNLNYWEFGDYLGIGAGAHAKLSNISKNVVVRNVRHHLPERYIGLAGDKSVLTETKFLTEADIILEFMMNALRLTAGFNTSLFEERTGLPKDRIRQAIDSAEMKGWLELDDLRIKPTTLGQNYLNDLLQCFMPDTEHANNYKHMEIA